MGEGQKGWRSRFAAPALAALMIVCCLAWPLIAGAIGSLAFGAVFGAGAAALALLVACAYAAFRLASNRRC